MIKDKNLKNLALASMTYESCYMVPIIFYVSSITILSENYIDNIYTLFKFYSLIFLSSYIGFVYKAYKGNVGLVFNCHEYRNNLIYGLFGLLFGLLSVICICLDFYKSFFEVLCPILLGGSSGIFWLGRLMLENTNMTENQRMRYVPSVNIMQQILYIVIPLIMSLILWVNNNLVLVYIFVLFLVLMAICILLKSFKNNEGLKVDKQEWSKNWVHRYKDLIVESKLSRHLFVFWFLDAVVYSMILAAIPMAFLLSGATTKNLGYVESFGAVCSLMVLFYLLPRWKIENRGKLYLFGSLGNVLGWLVCVVFKSIPSLMFWTMTRQLCNPIISTSNQTLIQSGVHLLSLKNNTRPQNFIFRETALLFGRFLGVTITLGAGVFYTANPPLAICVTVVCVMPVLGFLGHKVAKIINKESI